MGNQIDMTYEDSAGNATHPAFDVTVGEQTFFGGENLVSQPNKVIITLSITQQLASFVTKFFHLNREFEVSVWYFRANLRCKTYLPSLFKAAFIVLVYLRFCSLIELNL